MMVECCGQDRETKYCSDCGKRLKEQTPVDELREYLTQQLKRANTQRYKEELGIKAHRDGRASKLSKSLEWYEKDLAAAIRKITKWQRWIACLDELTNNGVGPADTTTSKGLPSG